MALQLEGAQALLVTSRNALSALATHRQLAEALALPLFAVGEATARAAQGLGFADVTAGPGTGEALAKLVSARVATRAGPARASCRRDAGLRPESGACEPRLRGAPAGALPGGCGERIAAGSLEPAQGRQARRRHPHVATNRQDLRRPARPAGCGNASAAYRLLLPVRSGSGGGEHRLAARCAWRRGRASKMSLRSWTPRRHPRETPLCSRA